MISERIFILSKKEVTFGGKMKKIKIEEINEELKNVVEKLEYFVKLFSRIEFELTH